ncbi:hypothetical protein V6Z12_A06G137600 [Gossypium hirsutum]
MKEFRKCFKVNGQRNNDGGLNLTYPRYIAKPSFLPPFAKLNIHEPLS